MATKQQAIKLYEIKITLKNLTPAIWRRVHVPRDITLGGLHSVIQMAMGWDDDHLHDFLIKRKRYGPMMDDSFEFPDSKVDEDIVHLNGVVKPKAKFEYCYDFGDSWRHEIHIEREVESATDRREARCIAGENACPPEDCGGPYGYADLLAALADPQNEEHGDRLDWVEDDFDPHYFDLAMTDLRLSKMKL